MTGEGLPSPAAAERATTASDPRSHGLWERTAPPAPETPALAERLRADVAVVGAGYTGLSAALRLAEAGRRVVVLEGAAVGFGGSGRNVGLVNAGLWLPPDEVAARLGSDHGDRLLALLGDAPRLVFDLIERHAIECEAERAGTLHCAAGAAGLREVERRAAQWDARGAPVRLLGAAETAARLGSGAYAGSLFDARAGTVQPLAYARGLARAAIGAGARVHAASPALRCERTAAAGGGGAAWRVSTPSGSVVAEWVVIATNAYTAAPWPELRGELVRLPYFNFATAPLGHNLRATVLPGREGAWDTRTVLRSFRTDRAGRLVVGSVGALRGTGAGVHEAWARRVLRRLFPRAGDAPFEAGWYGHIGLTTDDLPRFHRLAPNVVGFSGYNGRGIAPGTAFGRVLADHTLGALREADLPLPATEPRPAPFRRAREAAYEAGARLAHATGARGGA